MESLNISASASMTKYSQGAVYKFLYGFDVAMMSIHIVSCHISLVSLCHSHNQDAQKSDQIVWIAHMSGRCGLPQLWAIGVQRGGAVVLTSLLA